jgi:hypothetical protein
VPKQEGVAGVGQVLSRLGLRTPSLMVARKASWLLLLQQHQLPPPLFLSTLILLLPHGPIDVAEAAEAKARVPETALLLPFSR